MNGSHCWEVRGDDLVLRVRVQPRASREGLDGIARERLAIRVGAPPADGAANRRVLRLLAETLDLPHSALRIARGEHARDKDIVIAGVADRSRILLSKLGLAREDDAPKPRKKGTSPSSRTQK